MKVWLIENRKRYNSLLFHLFQQLSSTADSGINEFSAFVPEEVLQRLDSLLFEAENSVHITVIVDGEEVDFLSALYQLVIRSPYQQNNLRIIIFSTLESWIETYPNMLPTDLGTYFLARKANMGGNAAFRLENCYSQLEASRKIRSNLILLGLLYGGDGLDFKPLLRQIWEAKFPSDFATTLKSKIFPAIHYQHFLHIITTLILPSDSTPGFLIPAFDWEPRPLSIVLDRLNQAINYTNPSIASEETEEHKEASLSVPSPIWNIDFSQFYTYVKVPPHSFTPSEIESRFPTDWMSFLERSGLKTIHILLVGPPKAGKTTIGKEMSEKLQLTYVDISTAVLALLKFDSATIILPKHLDATKIEEYQQELKTWIEAKLMEGKKPGKDKNPTEPPPIDFNLITDTFCQSIPMELLRKALSYFLNTDLMVARKGSILDIWDGPPVLESLSTDFDMIMRLALIENDSRQTTPPIQLNIVIEFAATEKIIVDKQIELIGPANMKSKESQATIKNLETVLASYFGNCTEITRDEKSFKSHQKVTAYEECCGEETMILRWEAMPPDISQCFDELVASFRSQRAKAFGWLDATPIQTESREERVGEEQEEISVLGGEEQDNTGNEVKRNEEFNNETENLNEKKNSSIPETTLWQEMNPGIQKIDEFLTATLLPVLSKSMIDVVRNKPGDPILYIANYLAEISRHQQQEAYEHAKKQFEELLKS